MTKGVVSEACLPYESGASGIAGYCMYRCKDKSSTYKKYGCKFNSLKMPTTREDIQNELQKNGPMMVGLLIYEDFFNYAGGVYSV